MTLYKNKYRIESTRLPNRDYAANGYYFVTICTYKKFCYFGNIFNGQIQLSQVGKIAQQHWQEIPNHFDNVYIDAYVVMPNHIHGIIIIDRPTLTPNVETRYIASLQQSSQLNRFPVKCLTETERILQIYNYTFNSSPEPGKEYSAINRITWNIGTQE